MRCLPMTPFPISHKKADLSSRYLSICHSFMTIQLLPAGSTRRIVDKGKKSLYLFPNLRFTEKQYTSLYFKLPGFCYRQC